MRASTGFLVVGLVAGVVGAVIYQNKRREEESHDLDDLAERISDRLKALETRIEAATD